MQIKRGIAVSPGVVTGEVVVLGTEDFRIPQRFVSIDAVETELGRCRSTLDAVWEVTQDTLERPGKDQILSTPKNLTKHMPISYTHINLPTNREV